MMLDIQTIKVVQRRAVALTAVVCSLGFWDLLFLESLSYPIGTQDYGFPLTFKRDYRHDVVLFFPQALVFDSLVATLVIVAAGYSFWRWSAFWSTKLCAVFVMALTGFAILFSLRGNWVPLPLGLLFLVVMGLVVPITLFYSLCYV
jgi:hypothetical protein